jgi:drug/metabolite transporter (DMT)-like permease
MERTQTGPAERRAVGPGPVDERVTRARPTPLLVAAFAAVYLIWGSTYLVIHCAIETMPPLAMAGLRFLLAGAVLFPVAYLTGDRESDPLRPVHWRSALVIGALLVLGGNGVITLAEEHVASGLVALLVATAPIWMALSAHLGGLQRVSRLRMASLAAGLLGVGLMLRPGSVGTAAPGWIVFTLLSPLSWAVGSIYARGARMPRRPLLATSLEMLCGGALLCVTAGVLGEWGQVHPAAISAVSMAAFAYLVIAGSLVGYTAYTYLNGRVTPQAASSYAYVNPLVAMALGWKLLGETVTLTTLIAGGLIVVAVAVLLVGSRRPAARTAACSCPTGTEAEIAWSQEIA